MKSDKKEVINHEAPPPSCDSCWHVKSKCRKLGCGIDKPIINDEGECLNWEPPY